jgi:hypothetical protein
MDSNLCWCKLLIQTRNWDKQAVQVFNFVSISAHQITKQTIPAAVDKEDWIWLLCFRMASDRKVSCVPMRPFKEALEHGCAGSTGYFPTPDEGPLWIVIASTVYWLIIVQLTNNWGKWVWIDPGSSLAHVQRILPKKLMYTEKKFKYFGAMVILQLCAPSHTTCVQQQNFTRPSLTIRSKVAIKLTTRSWVITLPEFSK